MITQDELFKRGEQESGLPLEMVSHLAQVYGSRYNGILEIVRQDKRGAQPLCPHCKDILAQVRHAVEEESVLTVNDFLLRRSLAGLEKCQGLDAVDTVADEMGHILGWSADERQRQVEAYKAQAGLGQRFKVKV